MDYRTKGKNALNTILKETKNIDMIEKNIFSTISSLDSKDNEINYCNTIYEIIGDLLRKEKLKNILTNIKENKLGWNHGFYAEWQNQIEEQDKFIETPFLVEEEGVIECKKCKSKRVFYYQRQVRSSDEGFSLFCTCVKCGQKWREN